MYNIYALVCGCARALVRVYLGGSRVAATEGRSNGGARKQKQRGRMAQWQRTDAIIPRDPSHVRSTN